MAKFRVKRDYLTKHWKMGQEVSEDELDAGEAEKLKRDGVLEDVAAEQSQGEPQPAPGGAKPEVRK
jgi:hypothetical protein